MSKLNEMIELAIEDNEYNEINDIEYDKNFIFDIIDNRDKIENINVYYEMFNLINFIKKDGIPRIDTSLVEKVKNKHKIDNTVYNFMIKFCETYQNIIFYKNSFDIIFDYIESEIESEKASDFLMELYDEFFDVFSEIDESFHYACDDEICKYFYEQIDKYNKPR